MGSKTQTGLLLVLGTIVSAVGWMGLYPADGTGSAAEQAQAIMADADIAKVGILLGYGGMAAVFIGLFNITRGMATAGGRGSSCANVVFVLIVALLAGLIVSAGLELGTTEATSAAAGATLMGVSVALGSSFQIVFGLTLALLGIGIVLDKNLHIVAAAIAIIAGGLLLIGSFVEADALDLAGWIGFMLACLALGVLTIRLKS